VAAYQYTVAMSAAPMIIPGTTPARKSFPMETWAMTPYSTRLMLGGIMGPITADARVMAAANGRR